PLRTHQADQASESRAARSVRVWPQACIISATIAACASISCRSGGRVLSLGAADTGPSIIVMVIAAQPIKNLQWRSIVSPLDKFSLSRQAGSLGSVHHLRRSVIRLVCQAEEARQNVRPFRHAESESHACTDLACSLAIDARAA